MRSIALLSILFAANLLPIGIRAQTGDRQILNRTAVADTAVERLLAQRQAIRAGTDGQALESAIDPKTYILGPGDGVYLDVYSAHFLDQDLTVTPEGRIIVPRTGQIDVAGLTVPEAEKKINVLLARDYKNPQAYLSLRRLRTMKVSVLGEVLSPGVHQATAMMRVSEVINRAGDLTEKSSLRNIEIHRTDGSLRTKADLIKYYNTGDLSANPVLEGGDVIIVPRAMQMVMISGSVGMPGTLEYADGDKLSSLIALAKGLRPGARTDSVEIARFSAEDPLHARRMYVNYASGEDPEIKEGDVISIRGTSQYHLPRVVSVAGEVLFPGKYSIEVGETKLSDVLRRAGGVLPTGSLDEAVVLRRAGIGSWESDPEFLMIDRLRGLDEKRISDDQFNYYMARARQLGRSVMIVNFRALLEKGDASQDIVMRDEDSVWVPRARGFVSVIGSVNNQGNVSYTEGATFRDYVERAGGYTSGADRSSVRVINSRTSSYINPRSDGDYKIGPGDTIVVPAEHSEFWKNFELATAITAQVLTILAGIFLLSRK
ncbi:MAG: SLBB domain-containing protein [Bacteroidota bacterium]|nr:SLBB domain-containing protein [Bacteroidota bacterium]MDP4235437.1 SLBB domain-containing protein [Bacteroidota bacterium]